MKHELHLGVWRRATWVASLLLLARLSSPDPGAAEEEIWKTIFRGTAEVNVVNVDVVVTDRDGRPVRGLSKDDFVLVTDGQPTEISNFFAVEDGRPLNLSAGSAAAPAGSEESAAPAAEATAEVAREPAHLIIYVDNANISEINRARVFGEIREFLLAHRRFNAQVMLMSNERSLSIRQGFTSVPHEIFVALDELEKTRAASPRFEMDRREIIRAIERVNVEEGSGLFATKSAVLSLDEGDNPTNAQVRTQKQLTADAIAEAQPILGQIRGYSEQRYQHTLQTLRVLRQLTDTAAGLPGRKSVLYVSDGLPLRPGQALFEAYTRRFQYLAGYGGNLHPEMEAIRDDATAAFDKLVEHANASRVTFYTLDASPSRAFERASAATGDHSGGNFADWSDGMESTDERNAQEPLRLLADGTGGRFGLTQAAYDAVLTGVVADFDNYYSLGFVADRVVDGQRRAIEVRVADKDLKVRYRSSFRDKSVPERAAERAQAALLLDNLANPFGVALETAEHQPQDDGTFVVPLSVRIPLGKLVLLPGERDHRGQVSMFVVVRDEKGRTSEVNRHLCPIRIPNSEVLTALGQSAACGVRLLMRRGPQRVAVSVLDELTAIDSTVYLTLDVGAEVQQARLDSSP